MRRSLLWSFAVLLAALQPLFSMAEEWFENAVIGGDLRYRHERTDKEGSDARNRHRIRLRVGMTSAVNSNLTADVRLATGSTAPYTSDQSLTGSFSSKEINLDRAYLDWQPASLKGVHLLGGKMANPLFTGNGLVWDADVTPEGLAARYASGSDVIRFLAAAGGFWVEERSSDDDTLVYCGQLAVDMKGDRAGLLTGVGICSYDNMEGFPVLVDELNGFGNSVAPVTDGDGEVVRLNYAHDYNQVEGFAEVSGKAGPAPCKVRGHYVINTEADDDDTGYLVGFQIGKAKKPGSLQLDYDWRELEADAVVGALTDSNVWGGGTDGRGHRAYLTYQLAENWQLGAEYFVSEIGLDDPVDYNKLRLEVKAKF